jgi:hypothetical protein
MSIAECTPRKSLHEEKPASHGGEFKQQQKLPAFAWRAPARATQPPAARLGHAVSAPRAAAAPPSS